MINGATLLLLKYKLPYILHDPRNEATLLLLKCKLLYILHDPRNGATLLLLKYKLPSLHFNRSKVALWIM
jgi:hypothetical protein